MLCRRLLVVDGGPQPRRAPPPAAPSRGPNRSGGRASAELAVEGQPRQLVLALQPQPADLELLRRPGRRSSASACSVVSLRSSAERAARPPARARPGEPARPPPGRTCAASLRARRSASSRSTSRRCVSCTRAPASSRSVIASSAPSSASRAMRPCSDRNGFCRFSHSRDELTTASLICTVTMRSPRPRSLAALALGDAAQPGGQLLDDRLLVAEHLVDAHGGDLVLDRRLGLLLELQVDQPHRVLGVAEVELAVGGGEVLDDPLDVRLDDQTPCSSRQMQ